MNLLSFNFIDKSYALEDKRLSLTVIEKTSSQVIVHWYRFLRTILTNILPRKAIQIIQNTV